MSTTKHGVSPALTDTHDRSTYFGWRLDDDWQTTSSARAAVCVCAFGGLREMSSALSSRVSPGTLACLPQARRVRHQSVTACTVELWSKHGEEISDEWAKPPHCNRREDDENAGTRANSLVAAGSNNSRRPRWR